MKIFRRSHLPNSIQYNGETYALDGSGDKSIQVHVLSDNLRGQTDLRGNYYKPRVHTFKNRLTNGD